MNSAWALYTIRTPERDLVQTNLKSAYVPSLVYYPIPLSQQLAYKHYPAVSSGLTTSNILSECVLSIPMHPYLKLDEVHKIAAELLEMKA